MAETHPILEAAARAAERAYVETRLAAIKRARDQVPDPSAEFVAWHAAALSAARVILSAEPSEGQARVAWGEMPIDPGEVSFSAAAQILRASNAALLREIEGSEPATRDVGT